MARKRRWLNWLLLIIAVTIMSACSDSDSSGGTAEAPAKASLLNDPKGDGSAVNLATLTDAEYQQIFDSPKPTGFDMAGNEIKLTQDPAKAVAAVALSTGHIWVANSGEGTISKVDTATGQELGRYRTGPSADGSPSRTTVDKFGNVWVGNRSNNTVTKVGLKENNQCVDRNANGVIDTSTGGADVKAWTGEFGAAIGSAGTVVEDECILLHVALSAVGVTQPDDIRTVAIDSDNNVFVGAAYSGPGIFKINGTTGAIIASKETLQGHYGGVVDKNGNLWSIMSGSGKVQKTSNDLQTSVLYDLGHSGYGIAIDKYGKVWTTEYGSDFSTFDPADPVGTLKVFTQTGSTNAQGITTNKDGDVFIAGSLSGNTVGHYKQTFDNAGVFTGVSFVANYTVGSGPTGVAVDTNGNVWATNTGTNNVSRINLAGIATPPTGVTVDNFPVGIYPYNYSDMTGSVFTLVTAKPFGYWEPLIDSKEKGFKWKKVFWVLKQALKEGAIVQVSVKASDDKLALNAMEYVEVQNDTDLPGTVGQYMRLKIYMEADKRSDSPIITKFNLY